MMHVLFIAISLLSASQVFAQEQSCGSQAMMTMTKADGSKLGLFISSHKYPVRHLGHRKQASPHSPYQRPYNSRRSGQKRNTSGLTAFRFGVSM